MIGAPKGLAFPGTTSLRCPMTSTDEDQRRKWVGSGDHRTREQGGQGRLASSWPLVSSDLGDQRRIGHRRCSCGPVGRRDTDSERERSGDDVRPSQRLGTCRCGLVVSASSGWVRDIQVDITNRFASRWQGPGTIIPGIAWIGDQGLNWVPGGRLWGGRAFELRGGDIERIQVSSVGVRSAGLVVTTSKHGEAWLLFRRSEVGPLLMRLRGHDQLGGRADVG